MIDNAAAPSSHHNDDPVLNKGSIGIESPSHSNVDDTFLDVQHHLQDSWMQLLFMNLDWPPIWCSLKVEKMKTSFLLRHQLKRLLRHNLRDVQIVDIADEPSSPKTIDCKHIRQLDDPLSDGESFVYAGSINESMRSRKQRYQKK